MLDRFWELVGGVLTLSESAFRIVSDLPQGRSIALLVVLLAGLSQGLGQCVVLFIHRVKPLRFGLSLLIKAILFGVGFLALVSSTWLITQLPWSVSVAFRPLARVLGIAYAPLLFSFLGALPYLGVPILSLLAVWHLFALVISFATLTNVGLASAFGYVVLGWWLLQLLEQTLGRPLAWLIQWGCNTIAGVNLTPDRPALEQQFLTQAERSHPTQAAKVAQSVNTAHRDRQPPRQRANATSAKSDAQPGLGEAVVTTTAQPTVTQGAEQGIRTITQTAIGLVALLLFGAIALTFVPPVRGWALGWADFLPQWVELGVTWLWMGAIGLLVTGGLAPWNTLGWWAGWYEDDINTTIHANDLRDPVEDTDRIQRYVIYLDGVRQSAAAYVPEIETFLAALVPALPDRMVLIRDIRLHSVINRPLSADRLLSTVGKLAKRLRLLSPSRLRHLLINLRHLLIVFISADQRYGPLYNQEVAQVVFSSLVTNGYRLGSGIPVTLMGYGGGGQLACACAPYLRRALAAPIDVISLGTVISDNNDLMQLEQLHHLVGDRDAIERLGPLLFPGRWQIFPLSYWNRAKRRGKVTIVPLGPVGHQGAGGSLDPQRRLADGRSALQQTIATINAILRGDLVAVQPRSPVKLSNYRVYQNVPFCQPDFYPIQQTVDPQLYQPIADWMGRLILPAKTARSRVRGACFEVYHAPAAYRQWVGQVLPLRWSDDPAVQRLVKAVTRDVYFSADAEYSSQFEGMVLSDRVNHWRQVDPLESLAAGHPVDDLTVMLEAVEVRTDEQGPALYIRHQPVEITGRYYALVQFIAPIGPDRYRVRHFNASTRRFDGPEAVLSTPPVALSTDYGSYPSTVNLIEQSPCNEQGWYVYGAQNADGEFVVQAWMPRALVRLQPQRVIFGAKSAYRYIREETWNDIAEQKGHIASVLCTPQDDGTTAAVQVAQANWREGDRALVLHVYGGIGGDRQEPAAATPIFFGHFAYGRAEVVRDPLADELRFDIRYYQVYTQNIDGLVAGTLHWSRYLGDRQLGWLGNRPTCDILLKLPCFTDDCNWADASRSPLERTEIFLQAMTARYRIGNGTGATYVGPANNCAQDSNQALFAALQHIEAEIQAQGDCPQTGAAKPRHQAQRLRHLIPFGQKLKRELQPLGYLRSDWKMNEFNLGTTLEDQPFENLLLGLASWRTLLPRKASDTVAKVFLHYGAVAWVLRTNQVGGHDPDIEPIAPMTL